MRLIQAKVRCVEGVVDTGWLVPGRHTTLVYGPAGSGKSYLLKALQALNPIYDIELWNPFVDYPEVWKQGNYSRRVIPEKKTAVFMVFSAQPDLVRLLDAIDPALIETDRIEVGRRLDRSRWITFVEISASTRWSEIADEMKMLRSRLPQAAYEQNIELNEDFIDSLVQTDRIKGEVETDCTHWLDAVARHVGEKDKPLLKTCYEKVGRARRFRNARKTVEEWLPATITVQRQHSVLKRYPFSLFETPDGSFDPIATLLYHMFHTFNLNSAADHGSFLIRLEKYAHEVYPFMPAGIQLPEFLIDKEGFTITGCVAESRLARQIQLIALISLFSTLCYGKRPLLLLDQLEEGLDGEEIEEFVKWIQSFAEYAQLIFATGNKQVALSSGWQTVKTIGRGGLLGNDIQPG